MCKLQVLICTWRADGLARVAHMTIPPVKDVEYIVSCQSLPVRIPSELQRPDIRVCFSDSVGLSKNRNHALSLATAPIVLIADDDLHYTPQGLKRVIDAFDRNPGVDIATFKYAGPDKRRYPSRECRLRRHLFGTHYPVSFEIAFRRENLIRSRLRFSELAGINAPFLGAGEETLLYIHALGRGLNVRFFPEVIVHHPRRTTGFRGPTPKVMRARGAVQRFAHPFTGLPRLLYMAHRLPGDFRTNLHHLWQGWVYAGRHRAEL